MVEDPRLALIDLLNRYCDALDLRDWERLRGYFTDDAVLKARMVERGVRGPEINHVVGADQIIAMIQAMWQGIASTHHFVTNHRLEVAADGASASGTCRLRAYHAGGGAKAHLFEESLAQFDFEAVKVGAEWKVRHWDEAIFIMLGTDEVFGPA